MQNGQIKLTQGNINSSHFYLREVRSLFPPDMFGGSNNEQAPRQATIEWGGEEAAITDISTRHMIFRRRGWVREFFLKNQLTAGDSIGIEKLSDYNYRIFPIRMEPPAVESLNS